MAHRIDLNGSDWLYKDFVGEDWIWRDSEKPGTKDVRWWRQGSVPGTVLHDLWRNGETPDPYFERNSLLVEWVPERTWVYKKTFLLQEQLQGQRIQLHCKGVDYEALFFLNGSPIGRHTGMYSPAVFEVSESLLYGQDNLLAIVIMKAPDEQPQVSKTGYVNTHKSRMTYWWDFCPRMIHQGIWDDVYLEATGQVRIEDVYVCPRLSDDKAIAELSVSMLLSSSEALTVRIDTDIVQEGIRTASASSLYTIEPGATKLHTRIELPNPKLWWPNGSGEASLYEASVSATILRAHAGGPEALPSAGKKITFGIRDVRFEANDTPDQTAKPYTLVVNGRRTYIKGWNWVPIDVMYGVPRPEKLKRLILLAKRAGVNMLRVWGGGLIEKEGFYELCNRHGIMVWQEFIQSSSGIANKPSEEPAFLELMAREAEGIIPRKRNHPSLVLWCGGNELQGPGDVPLDDDEPVLRLLKEAVERLHPGALWLPTSPTGRLFLNSLKNAEQDPEGMHDVHGPWEHQGLTGQYALYNRSSSLLHSEFGVEGMTNLKALNTTINKRHQWPASRDNPVYFHRGAWWINEPFVQQAYGGGISDIPTLIRASQFLQAEGLRYAVESNLRRQRQNSGTLPWQFNEPYPNAYCTSALDYYAHTKPAYYAVARAYKPVAITASFDRQAWPDAAAFSASIWAVSSLPQRMDAVQVKWNLSGVDGTVFAQGDWSGSLEPGKPKLIQQLEAAIDEGSIFFLTLELSDSSGWMAADNRYVFSRTDHLGPLLKVPAATVRFRKVPGHEKDSWKLELLHAGDHAAIQLHLEDARSLEAEGYAYFSDNDFTLLPGESKLIEVEWSRVPVDERVLTLSGWNTNTTFIR